MASPTQLAYRTAKGIGVLNTAPVYEELPGFIKPEGNLRCCCYSPNGEYFVWASPEQVTVISTTSAQILKTLSIPNVFELGFSPFGTFVITWQRPTKDEDGNASKNLKVWQTISSDGQDQEPIGQFVQRNQTGWNLQYTSDEKFCARLVTNEVQFYESINLRQVWNKLIVEGVADFAISPGQNRSVAIFVPERKGQPASVRLYNIPNFSAPVSQKSFFKGDKVQMKWNANGTAVIILASTEVDKSNRNYFGESTMFLLTSTGFDARIDLDKEGPIHDVCWSPNSKEFGVIYGYMPAKTTIFNNRAQANHSFPTAPRNTIVFSPHGRFVIVAGFGNLQGDVDIYDLTKNYSKVSQLKAENASVCEWSPDGTHILFATTSPRLRVDNGFTIYYVNGTMMYKQEMNEMYHVCWRPQTTQSDPNALVNIPTPQASALEAMSKVKPPTKSVGAYRPPGARGLETPAEYKREDQGGSAYVSNGMPTASHPATFGRPRRREVPGAELADDPLPPGAAPGGGVSLTTGDGDDGNLSKAAAKNKKKREAKKAKDAAERDRAGYEGGDARALTGAHLEGIPTGPRAMSSSPNRQGGGHRRQKSGYGYDGQQFNHGRSPHRLPGHHGSKVGTPDRRNSPRPNVGPSMVPPAHNGFDGNMSQGSSNLGISNNHVMITSPGGSKTAAFDAPGGGNSPHDKKIRSLLKKMRAIDDLKMRQAGGEALEQTQVQKIASEESVRRELRELGIND